MKKAAILVASEKSPGHCTVTHGEFRVLKGSDKAIWKEFKKRNPEKDLAKI